MITLLGASGYVGQAFEKALSADNREFQSLSRRDVDYTRFDSLVDYLKTAKPEFLVNCAGYTGKPNVDACEKDKAAALEANAILPDTIRKACRHTSVPWGHVSSGCIFTGKRADGQGFTEEDVPNFSFRHSPCSWYSGSKALGEEVLGYSEHLTENGFAKWVHDDEPDCYIWRLRIPFDNLDSPRNYLSKLINYNKLLEAENSVSQLDEYVKACLETWSMRVPFGIYNVTNPGSVTTREVTQLISKSRVCDKVFEFFADDDDFYRTAAKTPRSNCVLDSSKLASVGIRMSSVTDAIERSLANWQKA